MNDIMNFNRIKNLILKLAKDHGIPEEKLIDSWNEETEELEWSIDYRDDNHQTFLEDVKNLEYSLDLYETAIIRNDLITANVGLLRSGIFAHNLMSFFDAIKDDLNKAMLDKRFDWPEIPEDYTIPEHYNYKGPK